MRMWFIALAIVGVLNAAISAGYYLRIVGVMYFRPSSTSLGPKADGHIDGGRGMCVIYVILGIYMLALYPRPLIAVLYNDAQPTAFQSHRTSRKLLT